MIFGISFQTFVLDLINKILKTRILLVFWGVSFYFLKNMHDLSVGTYTMRVMLENGIINTDKVVKE